MSEHENQNEMGDGNGSDDTETLLGAYVLDAVDDVERRRVERLLATDPAARAEVDRLSAASDRLAEVAAADATAPSGLLDSILTQVAERSGTAEGSGAGPAAADSGSGSGSGSDDSTGPVGPEVASISHRADGSPRRSRAAWILSAAAVVVLFVIGAFVVGSRSNSGPTDSVAAMEQLARDAATLPGARTGELTDAGNTMAVPVVVDPQGHAFVMSAVLPALPDGQTYQLWSVDGGTPVSLGLLGSDPVMSVVGVDSSVSALAITTEPAGGSAGPTTTPMASGTLSQA